MYPTGDECRASARDQPWVTMMEGLVGGSSFMFPFPQNPVFLHKLLNTYQSGLN
jgi:hypothetical protein